MRDQRTMSMKLAYQQHLSNQQQPQPPQYMHP